MKKNSRSFLAGLIGWCISLFIIIAIVGGVVWVHLESQLPDVEELKDMQLQEPLRVYSKDGDLIGEFGEIRRQPVALDQVPKPLIAAFLATEDQRFFDHTGVDPWGLLRAAVELAITGTKTQGGSTITMQVARNFYLTNEKTYIRKVNEILLAMKIDRELSKEKILELYLNRIYLGKRAYGVAAAAQVYYGKPLNELTIPELAMIAGLPKAPSSLNPIANPEAAKRRRDHVLERMHYMKYISTETYEQAINTPLTAKYHGQPIKVHAPYVAEMARHLMIQGFGEDAYTKGYHVYTTIETKMQEAANTAAQSALFAYDKRHGYRGTEADWHKWRLARKTPMAEVAFVALNPQDGGIKALVGGFDYYQSNFNRVTQAQRQPGSNFKPFIYAAALSKGYTLASLINDAPIAIYDPGSRTIWQPQNANRRFRGPTRILVGLTWSINTISIRLLQSIGIPYGVEYLTHFGFDERRLPKNFTLALGTPTFTPLEMATAYAVFANGGYRVAPYLVDRVLDSQGRNLYQAKPKIACEDCVANGSSPVDEIHAKPAISSDIAFLITVGLKNVIANGTGGGAKVLNRGDLAGKTGTTNNEIDAWFSGYNSDIVATAWVGFDKSLSLREYGARAALPLWVDFMKVALADKPEHTLPQPPNIVTAQIDPTTGLLAEEGQPGFTEYFEAGTAPTETAGSGAPDVYDGFNEAAPDGDDVSQSDIPLEEPQIDEPAL